jgi:dihydrofolate synthase/folylpolyglutamate synthase
LKQIRLASESSEGLFEAGEKFSLIQVKPDGTGTRFTVKGIAGSYENLWMPIIGEHQAENAATAIATVELFLGAGQRPIGDEILRSALADSTSPGRLQIVSKDPLIVLDGAHNPAGAKTLAQAIRTHFGSPRAIGLISMLADKDARSTLTELKNLFEILVVTQVENQRRMPASQLANVARELGYKNVVVQEDLSEALDYAKNNAVADALALFATGSLYMVGDLLKHFSSSYEMDDDGEN